MLIAAIRVAHQDGRILEIGERRGCPLGRTTVLTNCTYSDIGLRGRLLYDAMSDYIFISETQNGL